MAPSYNGTATDRWENFENLHREPGSEHGVNVGRVERLASGIAGAAIALAALRGHRLRGLLVPLGGGLLLRALTGRCAVNRALGRNSAKQDLSRLAESIERGGGIKIEKSVVVTRPREELYRFWRNFENLPRFMDHLASVTVIDENRSHWVARGPAGTRVEWDAEINNEIPNELIAWRTLPGSEINHIGSVHFEPRLPGPGTTVRVVLRYEPPAGKSAAAIASLFGAGPGQRIAEDLKRFRQVMEATEPIPPRS